ncbi:MAG: 2,3-bisphosphoglycerate-independent phosphoglycerate mutase, partial [Crocinitomicaceae bacterium]|nr:2,3-bisphosphoglycerate-independent phosphoglycerate mutase [Crocinitomicaceae bacterium]
MNKKVCLVVLDGWGHGKKDGSNAIFMANTPFTDSLYEKYPNAELRTDGENVGLPDGQMGNSEVGHMNIGAGRIVYQDLVKINIAIRDGSFFTHPVLNGAFDFAKEKKKKLHLIGLVSDGGVHSHINHLRALCELATQYDPENTFIHAFMDGRDTDPKSGAGFIEELEKQIAPEGIRIATV